MSNDPGTPMDEYLTKFALGALYDFLGWATVRDKRLILSRSDDASAAIDALKEFLQRSNVSTEFEPDLYWHDHCKPHANDSNLIASL